MASQHHFAPSINSITPKLEDLVSDEVDEKSEILTSKFGISKSQNRLENFDFSSTSSI